MSHAPEIHGLVRRIWLWICDAPSRLMAQLLQLWPIRGESTDKVGDTRFRHLKYTGQAQGCVSFCVITQAQGSMSQANWGSSREGDFWAPPSEVRIECSSL